MQSNTRHWQRSLKDIVAFVLPSSCVLCHKPDVESIYRDCYSRHFANSQSRCMQCGNLLEHMQPNLPLRCGHCLKNAPAFDETRVVADYTAPLNQLILSFKFAGKLALAPLFAHLLHKSLPKWERGLSGCPDLIVPMPLARQRLAERGFNQALEIARPLAELLNTPLNKHCVARSRETPPQSLFPLKSRARNIRGAFRIAPEAIDQIRNQHIAIVDDVMTSGASLNELAGVLKQNGAARVSNFVAARAPAY